MADVIVIKQWYLRNCRHDHEPSIYMTENIENLIRIYYHNTTRAWSIYMDNLLTFYWAYNR